MAAKDKTGLKIGDKVKMNGRYDVPDKYKNKIFTVRSEPWKVSGTMCVLLEDYSGGYAMDELTKIR